MTDRLLRAIACPWVDVLGHPLGRRHPQARAAPGRHDRVFAAAAAAGVAMEINAQIERLDLDEAHARRARDAGVAHHDQLRRAQRCTACGAALGRGGRAAGAADAGRRAQHAVRVREFRSRPAPASTASHERRQNRRNPQDYFAATPEDDPARYRARDRHPQDAEDDEERGKAAVFMEGLNEMRKEWKGKR